MTASSLDTSPLSLRKPRVREIVATARQVLEEQGVAALSMHRIAELLEIRTPSLYKHVTSKREIEELLVVEGYWELADAVRDGLNGAGNTDPAAARTALAESFRSWCLQHRSLYVLMTAEPLAGDADTARAFARFGDVVRDVVGSSTDAERWFIVRAHGLVLLELTGRTPGDWDLDAMWRTIAVQATT